jgi:GNAT superfamily N-acetyltransferase
MRRHTPATAGTKHARHGDVVDVELTDESEQMPPPAEVERLLARASGPLGAEAATLARASARMYSWARAIPGAVTASAHDDGRLVGFGYGYSWQWEAMTDAWALRLRDELGPDAPRLADTFAVVLLVVDPEHRRTGLGTRLLAGLARHADERLAWLQADAGSPLHATCTSLGWRALDDDADPVILLSD